GPWDADTEKNIISYQSPVGKALLGKKIGQTANVIFEGNATNFEVLSIDPYKES
ncbi:MAG TPA: GreA/GreB family elongation factor, partial [Leptospiraceae bacterium]|nr:GreA/GreB family elongation factor [Leptospiraceae bacterium]